MSEQSGADSTTYDSNGVEALLGGLSHQGVQLIRRFDGAVMVHSRCQFPDGDGYVIHVLRSKTGLRLSDYGHTMMHVSFDYDVDLLLSGSSYQKVEDIIANAGMKWDGGSLCIDTNADQLADAVHRFEEAISRIYELGTSFPL